MDQYQHQQQEWEFPLKKVTPLNGWLPMKNGKPVSPPESSFYKMSNSSRNPGESAH